MTDHKAAREALARISTVPDGNSTNGVVCTTYGEGQSIAALVEERDAQIAALHYTALALLESDENTGGNAGQMFYDALDKALTNTAATAAAHDARIRAEAIEECLKIEIDIEIDMYDGRAASSATVQEYRRAIAALRTMGGDDG